MLLVALASSVPASAARATGSAGCSLGQAGVVATCGVDRAVDLHRLVAVFAPVRRAVYFRPVPDPTPAPEPTRPRGRTLRT